MATPAPVAVPGEAAAPTGSGPTASPPPTSSNILFASTNGVAEGGEGTRGLLVSLLTLFDINHSKNLSRHEYAQAAGPLGFDTSVDAWLQLCGRFGDKSSKKQLEKHQDGRPVTGGEVDTTLDLTLLGEYFSNKYDPLLEELLRRLLRGVINVSARSAMLERRLRVVEDHLEVGCTPLPTPPACACDVRPRRPPVARSRLPGAPLPAQRACLPGAPACPARLPARRALARTAGPIGMRASGACRPPRCASCASVSTRSRAWCAAGATGTPP